jgi:hypothetical protein
VLGAVGYRFHAADHPDTMAAVQLLARVIGRGSKAESSSPSGLPPVPTLQRNVQGKILNSKAARRGVFLVPTSNFSV